MTKINAITINEALKGNTYPGRGIIIGRTKDGRHDAIAYFIMGRSENSRNRVFEETTGGIRTKAFDPEKCTDPSLIIYWPVRYLEDITIVSNGDQTDTVFDTMGNCGGTFEDALMSRRFEPDAPNYTPRISGMTEGKAYTLSIIKCEDGRGGACTHQFFKYDFESGAGHLIHTYKGDGNPLPSFEGAPKRLAINENDINEFADSIWNALDPNNRISLFVQFTDNETGKRTSRIINANCEK